MKLPKSWSDVSIWQFVQLQKVDYQKLSSLDAKLEVLSILSNKPIDYFLDLDLEELNKISSQLSFVNEIKFSEKIKYNFKLDGIRFEANVNINELTTAEYIDLMAYCKDKETVQNNLHNILAIFIKPKKRWFFKSKPMKRGEVAALFYYKLPITIAYPISVFFCELLNNLIKDMRRSLEKQTRKAIKILSGSLKSGGGI